METTGLFAFNGKVQPLSTATISPLDRGFVFGEAVSETICAIGSTVIDFDDHWERLESTLDEMEWTQPPRKKDVAFTLHSMLDSLQAPKNKKLQVRLVVTPGEEKCHVYIYAMDAQTFPEDWYKTGIRIRRKALGFTQRTVRPKTNSYFETKRALTQLKNNYDDVIWSNADQEITEGSFSNIFFIGRQGDKVEIVTPPETSGIVPGVTRRRILSLLQSAKIKADIATVFVDELPRFDEAFLCSSIRGLVPIRSIDQQQMHSARETSVFRQIERLYAAYIKSLLN